MGFLKVFLWSFLSFAHAEVPIEFESEFTTCLSSQMLWEEIEGSMLNSENTWLWANGLSSVQGEGLFDGARIQVTYNTGLFSPTYTYFLEDVTEGESMTYTALQGNHPFKGGATLQLTESGNNTVFTWTGLYITKPTDWLQRRFFSRFSKNFFEQLALNIKNQEGLVGCNVE